MFLELQSSKMPHVGLCASKFFLRLLGDKPSLGEAKLTHAWSLMRSRGDRGAGSPTDETDGKYLDQGTERLCIPSPPNFFPRL